MEDDVEDYDDFDRYSNGTNWGLPSPLSRLCEDRSVRFKEEFQKAMTNVLNDKFKSHVSHLLMSEGILISHDSSESWLDIVTSLTWEAALLIAPDTTGVERIDPEDYLKVKCLPSGLCSDSQLIHGLVFKKNATLKHMLTKHKNPKILLLEGMLGHSSDGLSSFGSMEQEKDRLKSITEMIETCHPNVVLVEKTVSRDVQESFRAKGITLVADMKPHRLQRIARYTDSNIFSSDGSYLSQKLKQCESLYFEKFVEEHGIPKGGKKATTTLMFLEGSPRLLGCTILLKGSHDGELKKIKCVVQSAFVVAYHLILETSFVIDLKAMFSTMYSMARDEFSEKHLPIVGQSSIQNDSSLKDSFAGTGTLAMDVDMSDGYTETPDCEGTSSKSNMDLEISSASNGFSSDIYTHDSNNGESELVRHNIPDDVNRQDETATTVLPKRLLSSISASYKDFIRSSSPLFTSASHLSFFSHTDSKENEHDSNGSSVMPLHLPSEETKFRDIEIFDSAAVVESGELLESISALCEVPVELCKANSDSEEKTEVRNEFDTVLDPQSIVYLVSSHRFSKKTCSRSHLCRVEYYKNFDVSLGKFLLDKLNQTHQCSLCGEPREDHVYNYVNQCGMLTLQVKRLPVESRLPGEAEGKLWMWARCSKCEPMNKNKGSTRRVLISSAARGLSFGKFLELSLSSHSAFNGLASCGHSLQRDYLSFYGLGPMVMMITYSSVNMYKTCMPPPVLDFNIPAGQDWMRKEEEIVLKKGMLLFSEVTDLLQKISSDICSSNSKPLSNLTGLVKKISEAEEMLKEEKSDFEAKVRNVTSKKKHLRNSARKLLNFNSLIQELMVESYVWDQRLKFLRSTSFRKFRIDDPKKEKGEELQFQPRKNEIENPRIEGIVYDETSVSFIDRSESNVSVSLDNCSDAEHPDIKLAGRSVGGIDREGFQLNSGICTSVKFEADECPTDDVIVEEHARDTDLSISQSPLLSIPDDTQGLFWNSFPEILNTYKLDRKFEFSDSYNPQCLSSANELITEEGCHLHITLGSDDNILSDYENEITSIIACALAMLYGKHTSDKDSGEKVTGKENAISLDSDVFVASPYWSSNGSLNSEGVQSTESVSSEDSDASLFNDAAILTSENPHPEISLGGRKSLKKEEKYSVTCFHANQFRALRRHSCPCEVDFIASLSRCKTWDAKGGKSGALFVKTLDERFIVKQIQKTEIDSFLKFSGDYFKYVNQALSSGSQTCLARILGIYQVNIRQGKSAKDVKYDLMVMENLVYGRNITRLYDLKGAEFARYNKDTDGTGNVFLDTNFVEDMDLAPLYIDLEDKHLLQRALWNDTHFLSSINVMDYSLLVGVDTERNELVCGIIDYLRQYTWDKQLETWVKASLVVPKNTTPTVISPKEYKKRFRKFMDLHFLSLPKHCGPEICMRPSCKVCGPGPTSDSFQLERTGNNPW
ncbi:1-phosphatidylinositol-3-phosphate 5-kinase [Ranunculus cassubicifolius]